MEAVQRLVRSLKSARSYDLPNDPKAAYFMLLAYVMQNQYKTFIDLLGTSNTFDVNFSSGKSKRTLLHMAANVGAYECLCHLLKKGAVPNVSDRQGITPLQVAARNGYIRCVVKLLEFGADLEIKNNEGMTAIHWLAANGRTEVFAEIMKYISNIDIVDENKQTPLHVACMNGHIQTVRKLLELNADMERISAHGCTALYYAAAHGHAEVIKELIHRRASFTKNNDGKTPLDAALEGGHGKVCYLLITSFPNLLHKLLDSCMWKEIGMNKILPVLSFITSQDISFRNLMLVILASTVHTEGLKLLSTSSDYNEASQTFLKNMELFNYLYSFNPKDEQNTQDAARLRSSSVMSRRGSNAAVTTFEQFEETPSNLYQIELTLNSLWSTMESWMNILHNEISKLDKVDEASLRDFQDSDTASILSFASQLKKSSAFKRQVSKLSVSLDMLRSSQPAVEIHSGFDGNLSMEKYVRSNSYQNAVSTSSDNFEHDISSSEYEGDIHEYTLHHDEEIFPSKFNDVNDEEKMNEASSMSGGASPITEANTLPDFQLVDLTSDRLCAIIHGYFLYCKTEALWEKREKKIKKKLLFKKFLQINENVLQLLVSRKTKLIFEHFSFILDDPILFQRFLPAIHSQPFADRQKWFYERLYEDKKRSSVMFDEQAIITVARDSLLQTSCKELTLKNQDVMKRNVTIRFEGEDGMGAGVTREWLDLLVKEILNPDCALFTLSTDGSTFQPNSNSAINPDHLSYFQFAGRTMGLALYHKHLITAYFTRSFYKHILGIPVSYQDVESIDPEYSKNLQWILDNSIDDMGLDIPFSVETDVFGQTQEVELKPNGKDIAVNDENKFEYVNLAADLRMTKAIKPQILAFLTGFNEYIPHSLVSLFNEYELELLLSGVPDIDINDWMKNTSYQAGFTETDQTIQWFWEVVKDFTQEEQVQLLQFVTGTSRVPWGGFSNLSGATGNQLFTICRTDGRTEMLPTASTCFNMLKLPDYETKEDVKEKLKIAVTCGSLGFEFT